MFVDYSIRLSYKTERILFEKGGTIRFPMLNLQDNKRLTFRQKFPSMNPKDHVEAAGCDRPSITYDIPFSSPVASVSWAETEANCCLFVFTTKRAPRLRLEELPRRYEKGVVGDARAYRIFHSVAYTVRAVGGTRRYQPGN